MSRVNHVLSMLVNLKLANLMVLGKGFPTYTWKCEKFTDLDRRRDWQADKQTEKWTNS